MEPQNIPYQRLSIYQTKARLYIVGYCKIRGTAALLKISKQEPNQLDVAEVVGSYSLDEIRTMLSQIHMANAHLGGLQLVTHCCGIIGCFRFTETHYLLLVTRKAHVGSLCGGHKVYTVAATALVPLHPGYSHTAAAAASPSAGSGGGGGGGVAGQPSGAAEKRYVKLLMGMDLTKHFYFSYTYDLAHTVQRNCGEAAAAAQQQRRCGAAAGVGGAAPGAVGEAGQGGTVCSSSAAVAAWSNCSVYDSMFTWNAYLTSALRRALGGNPRWTVPLIHGFWEQRRLSIYGRPLTLTLIARRSRHFAGTRYRKRGLNDGGRVANEVETEQVVDAGTDYRSRTPLLASVVQVRGSVPLFWSQQLTALSPKPEIVLQQFDPLYEVTETHFFDLEDRYGCPLVVLNLLKSKERRPREVLLRRELAAAVAQLNAQRGRGRPHVVYIPWDFSKHAKQSGANLLGEIAAITRLALDMTGLFVHNPSAPVPLTAPSRPPPPPPPAAAVSGGGLTAPQPSFHSGGGGGPRSVGRSSITVAAGGGGSGGGVLRRSIGEGGSTAHLAAAAEAAAAAVRARSAAAVAGTVAAAAASRSGLASPPSGRPSLDLHGVRRCSGGGLSAVQWQSGVLRTNCIDCLDRTNVAQFAFGLVAFGRQLYKLGLHDVREVDADSSAAFTLMALYEAMGHVLSLQYGGSEAHTIFFQRKKGEWEAATQSKDMLTSIKRLYSNTYTDAEKQDAINLFLGNFVPQPNQPHIWQLDTDQYLHSETTLRPPPPPLASGPEAPTPPLHVSWGASEERPNGPVEEKEILAAAAAAAAADLQPSVVTRLGAARVSADWTAAAAAAPGAGAGARSGAADTDGGRPTSSSTATGIAGGSDGGRGGPAKFPGLPPESTPLPLELSSDDDDDARSKAYHEPGGGDAGASGSGGGPATAAAYGSAAIPFHRAPSSGGFLSGLLPSMGRNGGGRGSSTGVGGGGGGPGFFERVVTSLLQPGGAGAAARSAAAGVAGGDVASGSSRSLPGRLLVSFDQALARQPNQVWPILLHGEEDKQGRWTAVQSAFSFFWTSNAGGGGGDGATATGPRNNYQLDDAPRPQARPSQSTLPVRQGPLSPAPSGAQTPLSPSQSGYLATPLSPDASRHGGTVGCGGSIVPRTLTAGTDGGISAMSDGSPRSPGGAAAAAVVAGASAGTAETEPLQGGGRSRNFRQVLDGMVDFDHMDEHHGRDTTRRTVAETIPALGGVMGDHDAGSGGGAAAASCGSGGVDDDDTAHYYSVGDGEAAAAAAAGQVDGAGGVRRSVRQLNGVLLGPGLSQEQQQPLAAAGAGGGGKPAVAAGAGSAVPVLNDFIEVSAGPAPYNDWRMMGEGHTLDPAMRRRAVAEAAARAREEERQRKLVTAGLEVNDMLGLGLEDLGVNWELQPWWALEPRPTHLPRPHEPQPGRLRLVCSPPERERRERQQQPQPAAEALMRMADGEAAAAAELAVLQSYVLSYVPPPAHVLQRKQQVEQMALLHFDVARSHARAKFGEFLGSIDQPYGLYGEERRRDIAAYDALCYLDSQPCT